MIFPPILHLEKQPVDWKYYLLEILSFKCMSEVLRELSLTHFCLEITPQSSVHPHDYFKNC